MKFILAIVMCISTFVNASEGYVYKCKSKEASFSITDSKKKISLSYKVDKKVNPRFFNFLEDSGINKIEKNRRFNAVSGLITLSKNSVTSVSRSFSDIEFDSLSVSGATDDNNIKFYNKASGELILNYSDSTSVPAVFFGVENGSTLIVSFYKFHTFELNFNIKNCSIYFLKEKRK